MKKAAFRGLVLLLAILCCVTACKRDPGSEEPTKENVPTVSVADIIENYTVVTPEFSTDGEKAALQLLLEAYGDDVRRPKSDYVGRGETIPQNNNEILIGNTNRASSQAAMANLESGRDYSVSFYDGEVVIVGKSDRALIEAVQYFVDYIFYATSAEYPIGYIYYYDHVYPFTDFFGLNLSDLRLVYTDPALEDAAQALQTYIDDCTGVVPEVQSTGDGNVILTVDTSLDASAYKVDVTDTSVTIRSGCARGVDVAVEAIVSAQKGSDMLSFDGVSAIPLSMKSKISGKEMYLVWNDEFDAETLDTETWNLYDRMWGTRFTSTTDEKNIMMQDGQVVMRTWYEGVNDSGTAVYSTHKTLTTWDRMSFQYGYLEIYAKVPFYNGAFPSLWLQSAKQHRSVDYMTEVDIFEVYNSDLIESTLHKWYLDENGSAIEELHTGKVVGETRLANKDQAALSEEYHLYGFGWTPTLMYFTLDGEIFATFDLEKDFSNAKDGMEGFRDPMVINFTNWIAGTVPGWKADESTEYPLTFSVDWIRLYQIPGEGGIFYP
ncbi:MAG: family 16 glycosylhydrolase [Eubacteriales bacterium]